MLTLKICRVQKFLDGRYYPMAKVQVGTVEDFTNWIYVFGAADGGPWRFKQRLDAQDVCTHWCRDAGWEQEPDFYCLFFDLRHTLEITGRSTVMFRDTGIPQLNTIMR